MSVNFLAISVPFEPDNFAVIFGIYPIDRTSVGVLEITHLTHVLCQHYVFWDQLLTFALPYSPSLS